MGPAVDHADKLARVDRDIARIEGRVAQQLAFIERTAARGHDTALARAALRVLEFDLEVLRRHRGFLSDDRDRPTCRPPTRRPRRRASPPRPDGCGREAPRPEEADAPPAAGPALAWESLPNRALIARTEDYLLVVRPTGAQGRAFRFAVLKPLPANGGLLHVTTGNRRTARDAMLAAERAIVPPPGATAPGRLSPPAPEGADGGDSRIYTPPEVRPLHPPSRADREGVEAPPFA